MNMQEQKIHTFHIEGMHCDACVILTESELHEVSYITKAKSSLKHRSVEITGYFADKPKEVIAQELSDVLSKHGYTLSVEKRAKEKNLNEFKIAIPAALAFIVLFIFLQKVGLINVAGTGNVSYGTAFLVGVMASLSTCMAVVGGLVLSMSATFAKEGDKIRPQFLFHAGRLLSFFLLGGVIGIFGSAFTINPSVTLILSIFIGIIMLTLGINLFDIYHWPKRFQPSLPKFFSKHAVGISKLNHTLTPFLVGIVTFFLPCGFTQSMQLYTLTTGNFLAGGLTMLSFALGTLPVLSIISFSSLGIQKKSRAGVFFKTAGLIVISFALFNIINSLVVAGVISPIFSF